MNITGYLTPDDVPEDRHCRELLIPNSTQWLSVFMGALLPLVDPASWQQYGTLTPQEAADAALNVIWEAYANDVGICAAIEPPYWDSAANVADELPEGEDQPWYGFREGDVFIERIADWIIAGFIAYAGRPDAAVWFLTIAPQFRLAFKTGDIGGIVRVIIDAVEIGRVNTYSASPGFAYFDVITADEEDDHVLELVLAEEVDPAVTVDPIMQIVRKKLDPAEISDPDFRYDPECDCVQRTGDNGATWVDSPQNDVRHADAWRLPPIDADDPRCQAAANMSRWLSNWFEAIDPILAAASSFEALASIVVTLFLVLGPFALVLLALDVAFILFTAGASVINAAFTNETFDTLTCIFYCNIGEDGQCSAEQLEAINSDIDEQLGGIGAIVLHAIFAMVGEVGLSNWGTTGEAPADCDECGCDECLDLLGGNGIGTWTPDVENAGVACCDTWVYRPDPDDDIYSDTACSSPATGYLAAGLSGILTFKPAYASIGIELNTPGGSAYVMRLWRNGVNIRNSTTGTNPTVWTDLGDDPWDVGDNFAISIEIGEGSGVVPPGWNIAITSVRLCNNLP